MTEDRMWGDATVTYPDWVGTVAIDEKKTTPTLLDLVDLNAEAWIIVGINIGGGESGHDIRVLATPNVGSTGGSIVVDIAANNGGEIPVTEFLLHDVDPYQLLRQMSHMLDLRVRLRAFAGASIRITDLGDLPPQS